MAREGLPNDAFNNYDTLGGSRDKIRFGIEEPKPKTLTPDLRFVAPAGGGSGSGSASVELESDKIKREIESHLANVPEIVDEMLRRYESAGTVSMYGPMIKDALRRLPERVRVPLEWRIEAVVDIYDRLKGVTGSADGVLSQHIGTADQEIPATGIIEIGEVAEFLNCPHVHEAVIVYGRTNGLSEVLVNYKGPYDIDPQGKIKTKAGETAVTTTYAEVTRMNGGRDLAQTVVKLEIEVEMLRQKLSINGNLENDINVPPHPAVGRNVFTEMKQRAAALKVLSDQYSNQLGEERAEQIKLEAADVERRARTILKVGGFFSRMNAGLTVDNKDEFGELMFQGSRRIQRSPNKPSGIRDTVGRDMSPLQSGDFQPIVPTGKYLGAGEWATDLFHYARSKKTGDTLWKYMMSGNPVPWEEFNTDVAAQWQNYTRLTNLFVESQVLKTEWDKGPAEVVATFKNEKALGGTKGLVMGPATYSAPILSELKARNDIDKLNGGSGERFKITKDGWIVDTRGNWSVLSDFDGNYIPFNEAIHGAKNENRLISLRQIQEGLTFIALWTAIAANSESWLNEQRKLPTPGQTHGMITINQIAEIERVVCSTQKRKAFGIDGKGEEGALFVGDNLIKVYGLDFTELYRYGYVLENSKIYNGTKPSSKQIDEARGYVNDKLTKE